MNPRGEAEAAALAYADRGLLVVPWQTTPEGRKIPLTEHGRSDATIDKAQIIDWWRRWPNALVAIATGEESGVVAVDIDVTAECSGFDTLEELGVTTHPETPTAHTPRGGCHLLFRHPGRFVKTIAGKLGRGLDIRGDGGSLILPPGPGRAWDAHLGIDTPLASFPAWAVIPDEIRKVAQAAPVSGGLSRYGEVALDNAIRRIVTAGPGSQEATLNTECYSVGRLVGGAVIPASLALDALLWAAGRMPSHDARRPWRARELDRKVRDAFTDGLRQPRGIPDAA